MNIFQRSFCGFIVWLLFSAIKVSYAETSPVLVMDPSYTSGTRLGSFVEYVQDNRSGEHFDELRQDWQTLSPQHRNSDHINLGPTAKPHWFRLLIRQNEHQKIILEHDYPVDLMEVFVMSPRQEVRSMRLGYKADSSAGLDYRHPTI